MEYLYVCLFSNGHIKVGRSIDPNSRIAQHAERVACLGIELLDHHVTVCTGSIKKAETELIKFCTARAVLRHKNEWFVGLDFVEIAQAANGFATAQADNESATQNSGIRMALSQYNDSASALAAAVGNGVLRQHVEHWAKAGRVAPEWCAYVSLITGLPLSGLNDRINWELIRSDLVKA